MTDRTKEPPPLISAVIPTFDRPDHLERAVNSVLAQDYPNVEVIVVDDHSPADPQHVISGCQKPVKFFRMPTNGGANRARNKGIDLAGGDFIAFLDDDDEWRPNKLTEQMKLMDQREACLCQFHLVEAARVSGVAATEVTEGELRRGNRVCGTSGLLVRRNVIEQLRFDEQLRNGQDWDVYVRLAQRQPIAHVPTPLFDRRLGEHSSITLQSKEASIDQLRERLRSADKHREWLGDKFYRRRVAQIALSYFPTRKNSLSILAFALERAGSVATFHHLFSKAMQKVARPL